MSKRTYVCFACRLARRKEVLLSGQSMTCPSCGTEMENLGYKLRVPGRAAVKSWRRLECFYRAEKHEELRILGNYAEGRKKTIREELRVLRGRPLTKGRAEVIQQLEMELTRLHGG